MTDRTDRQSAYEIRQHLDALSELGVPDDVLWPVEVYLQKLHKKIDTETGV